jgi:hypothetical protein
MKSIEIVFLVYVILMALFFTYANITGRANFILVLIMRGLSLFTVIFAGYKLYLLIIS